MSGEPQLRLYQTDVIGRIAAEVKAGRRRILLVAPTRSGKTVIARAIVADSTSQQKHILFLAHRRELIQQASAKLHALGVDHGIIQAGFPTRPCERVPVASISTLPAKEKFGHWPRERTVRPRSASPEIRAWVRSRQIAYAKAMAKQSAAA